MKKEKGVKKSRVVKAIYLRFSFLKRWSELLIIALIDAGIANTRGTTIYRALNINEHLYNKKQRIIKNLW